MPCRRLRTPGNMAAIQRSRKGKIVEVGDTTVHDRRFAPGSQANLACSAHPPNTTSNETKDHKKVFKVVEGSS